jgi:hypothetical protein
VSSCPACNSCNVTGKQGSCQPVVAGTDDANCSHDAAATCLHTGLCDGAGHCAYWAAGTQCSAQSCSSDRLSRYDPQYCPGNGQSCPLASPISCNAYKCDSSSGYCYGTCGDCGAGCTSPGTEDASRCAPGHVCNTSGMCYMYMGICITPFACQ